MVLLNPLDCFDPIAKERLMEWARHLASDEEIQRELVERTIAAAAVSPGALDLEEPTDRTLHLLMLQLFRSDFVPKRRAHEDLLAV